MYWSSSSTPQCPTCRHPEMPTPPKQNQSLGQMIRRSFPSASMLDEPATLSYYASNNGQTHMIGLPCVVCKAEPKARLHRLQQQTIWVDSIAIPFGSHVSKALMHFCQTRFALNCLTRFGTCVSQTPSTLRCGHTACVACLKPHVTSPSRAVCPACKAASPYTGATDTSLNNALLRLNAPTTRAAVAPFRADAGVCNR